MLDHLKQSMQGYIGQLNQLNQKVNEVVGAIKAMQHSISTLEAAAQENPANDEPIQPHENDVAQ